MTCNKYQKSTLVASVYNQNVSLNGTIPFTNIRKTGTAISMNSANNSILLNKSGLYEVNVSASVTPVTDATASTIQLNRNGVAMIDGMSTATLATAEGNTTTLSFSTIVEVKQVCNGSGINAIPLTLTSTGQEETYNNVIVSVIKIA